MPSKAEELVDLLRTRKETVSVCESLTAGAVCAEIATIPGASAVLRGGLVTYATELKHELAGVPEHVLSAYGPVSAETARDMARGVRKACGSSWGISLTGVAGPDMQDGHPVGEVYVGIAGPHWTAAWQAAELVDASRARFIVVNNRDTPLRVLAGDRAQIRHSAVDAGLETMLRVLNEQKLNEQKPVGTNSSTQPLE
ncbi:CinA family protein [Corynebacterium cystitidis]|uniref:CinA family protein n=1 Tax=Corynebacterium cystitidis TaxID=35757 RepID=UPI00211ED865|nr:CinA family protein [Corynebacterium cystitidis]